MHSFVSFGRMRSRKGVLKESRVILRILEKLKSAYAKNLKLLGEVFAGILLLFMIFFVFYGYDAQRGVNSATGEILSGELPTVSISDTSELSEEELQALQELYEGAYTSADIKGAMSLQDKCSSFYDSVYEVDCIRVNEGAPWGATVFVDDNLHAAVVIDLAARSGLETLVYLDSSPYAGTGFKFTVGEYPIESISKISEEFLLDVATSMNSCTLEASITEAGSDYTTGVGDIVYVLTAFSGVSKMTMEDAVEAKLTYVAEEGENHNVDSTSAGALDVSDSASDKVKDMNKEEDSDHVVLTPEEVKYSMAVNYAVGDYLNLVYFNTELDSPLPLTTWYMQSLLSCFIDNCLVPVSMQDLLDVLQSE